MIKSIKNMQTTVPIYDMNVCIFTCLILIILLLCLEYESPYRAA